MNRKFVEKIDFAVLEHRFGDRAKFIRAAIIEKLQSLGIEIPEELAAAPSRAGKGGPKPTTKSQPITPMFQVPHHGKSAHPKESGSAAHGRSATNPSSAAKVQEAKRALIELAKKRAIRKIKRGQV